MPRASLYHFAEAEVTGGPGWGLSLAAVYAVISSGATEQAHSTSAHTILCPPKSLPQPQGPRGTAPTLGNIKAAFIYSGCFVCRAGKVCPHPGLLCSSLAAELMHVTVQGLWLPSRLLGCHFLAPVVSSHLVYYSVSPCFYCLPNPGCSLKSL